MQHTFSYHSWMQHQGGIGHGNWKANFSYNGRYFKFSDLSHSMCGFLACCILSKHSWKRYDIDLVFSHYYIQILWLLCMQPLQIYWLSHIYSCIEALRLVCLALVFIHIMQAFSSSLAPTQRLCCALIKEIQCIMT